MLSNKQEQTAGDNSTNIQATEVVLNQGLTYSEARQVALDVFKANFFELVGEAKRIASERAEQVTEEFLLKLQKENPQGIVKSQDPDFQHALFTVQKEYARTGDKELGDLLVELLIDRSKQDQRNILQIVLNESLNVAPKITGDQLSVLSIIFLFKYTQNFGVGNHSTLGEYFDKMVKPFCDGLLKNESCYQHLAFSGCGSVSIGTSALEGILGMTYQGLFLKGFENQEIQNRAITIGFDSRFFMPCLNDPQKVGVENN